MNTQVIDECKKLSLEGKITFPEVIKRLGSVGAERYIMDLVGMRSLCFGIQDEVHVSTVDFEGPKVSFHFDSEKVQEAIREIQNLRIDYRMFLTRIMEAGCTHYEVFISGRKAIYFGRDGAMHIEDFKR